MEHMRANKTKRPKMFFQPMGSGNEQRQIFR